MNEENSLVSVIVTTYNRKELLKETLDSILNQTFKNFELIVVDNYSNYNFFSFIEYFNDERIKPFQNKNNGIIAVNRNCGIRKAKGEYIAFCDDDDLWLPQKLEEQLKHFNDDIVGVGSSSILFGDIRFHRQKIMRSDALLKFDDILRDGGVPLSSLMIRNIGYLFDENKSLTSVEDFDLQLTIMLKTRKMIKLLSSPLVIYRVQSTNSNSYVRKSKNSLNIIKKYEDYLSEVQLNELYSTYHNNIGLRYLRSTTRGGFYHFKEAIKYGSLKNNIVSIAGLILSLLPSSLTRIILKIYYKIIKILFSAA